LLGWSPSECSAVRVGELANDQVIGILDHVFDHPVGYRPIDHHSVPVPLVQVISREYGRVRRAELFRE
jgi:hypothetical protein